MANTSTRIKTGEARLRFVPLTEMTVSDKAQRELSQHRVNYLIANFEPEQFGTPTVNLRDGLFYIIDGQQRIAALKEWFGEGWVTQHIQCWVYEGLTEIEEADKFDQLNDVLTVRAMDKFLVRVTAERPMESDIDRIVRSLGLVVAKRGPSGPSNGIGAIATLGAIYKRSGPDCLAKALRIIRDGFGDIGFEAPVIAGMGLVCHRYDEAFIEKKAVESFRKLHGGVSSIKAQAQVMNKQLLQSLKQCTAAALVDAYNKTPGRKLTGWWREEGVH